MEPLTELIGGDVSVRAYPRRVRQQVLPGMEIPLPGGRMTVGVVRVDDTVRRPAQPTSPFVAALLGLLAERRFTAAPRHLGRDAAGRDTFSYIDGVVHPSWRRHRTEDVAAAGTLLRAFHEATRGSDLAGNCEVVCHHDPGPNNFVFRDGAPVALIDFDMAAPGDPIEDVAYAVWAWCLSSRPDRQPIARQVRQVRALIDAYDLDDERRRRLVDAICDRQTRNVHFWSERLQTNSGGLATAEQMQGSIDWTLREHAYVVAHRDAIASP